MAKDPPQDGRNGEDREKDEEMEEDPLNPDSVENSGLPVDDSIPPGQVLPQPTSTDGDVSTTSEMIFSKKIPEIPSGNFLENPNVDPLMNNVLSDLEITLKYSGPTTVSRSVSLKVPTVKMKNTLNCVYEEIQDCISKIHISGLHDGCELSHTESVKPLEYSANTFCDTGFKKPDIFKSENELKFTAMITPESQNSLINSSQNFDMNSEQEVNLHLDNYSDGVDNSSKFVQPLVYDAKTLCDEGIKAPVHFTMGTIPVIKITEPDPPSGCIRIDQHIISTKPGQGPDLPHHNLVTSRDLVNDVKPLSYNVWCTCDLMNRRSQNSAVDWTARSDVYEFLDVPHVKKAPSYNTWPSPNASNEALWADLPVNDQISVREREIPVQSVMHSEQPGEDVASSLADAPSDTVTHLGQKKTSRGQTKPEMGNATRISLLLNQMRNTRGAAPVSAEPTTRTVKNTRSIDSFFKKSSSVICESTSSTATLVPQDSNLTFSSKIQGRNFNAEDYISNGTVTHTILSSNSTLTGSSMDKLDSLDEFNIAGKCPKKTRTLHRDIALTCSDSSPAILISDNLNDTQDKENLEFLAALEINDATPLPTISLPQRSTRRRKRRRKSGSTYTISSDSDDNVTPTPASIPRKLAVPLRKFSVSDLLQKKGEDGEIIGEDIDYEEVLARNITVPQEAADAFRKTRGALVAESKGKVRAEHLRAMTRAERIPGWALGLEPSPAYMPNNRDLHMEMVEMIRRQAKERMLLLAEGLDAKARYFRNIAEAGLKSIEHLYGDNKAGYGDCRDLLKALAMKDKVNTRKTVQKTEVEVGLNPISDDQLISQLISSQAQGSKGERPLVFRPKDQKKEDRPPAPPAEARAGTSTGGTTPSGADAIGSNRRRDDQQDVPKGKKWKRPRSPSLNRRKDGERSGSPFGHPPSPKRHSPEFQTGAKSWKKGYRIPKKNTTSPKNKSEKSDFSKGRPKGSRSSTGQRFEGQRPRNQEGRNSGTEEMLLRILRQALADMSQADQAMLRRRRRQKPEE